MATTCRCRQTLVAGNALRQTRGRTELFADGARQRHGINLCRPGFAQGAGALVYGCAGGDYVVHDDDAQAVDAARTPKNSLWRDESLRAPESGLVLGVFDFFDEIGVESNTGVPGKLAGKEEALIKSALFYSASGQRHGGDDVGRGNLDAHEEF